MSIRNAGQLIQVAEEETRERCAEIARTVARAASKGTYGRLSVEQIGEKISEHILAPPRVPV